MSTARVNGVELSYEASSEGSPAIFIHGGFGGPQSTLAPRPRVIDRAAPEGTRLVVYDRRCAGDSEYTLDWFSLEDLAADARALLAHLGIESSVVIGSSMGGMVAQQYALSFPAHVSALALLNTGPDLMSRTTWGKNMAELAERARRDGDRAGFDESRERLRNPPEPPGRADMPAEQLAAMRAAREQYLARLAETSDEELLTLWSGAARNYAAFVGYDFTSRLGEIDLPTFILHGTADATVPYECAEELASGIAGAALHPIPGAIHGILQYPAARDALRGWLEQVLFV